MQENTGEFIKVFNSIARHKHRYEVFQHFVTMSAISLHNAVAKDQSLEDEYMAIVGKYSKDDASRFAQLLGLFINLLDADPSDVLGRLYMELEISNLRNGQFFTPSHLSELIAKLCHGDRLEEQLKERPFVTFSEPACGSGGMVLAFVKEMLNHGFNPADKLFVSCIDVDRLACMMTYLQLSLWNVPAEIVEGNTLSMDLRRVYYTPAYYLYGWERKLEFQQATDSIKEMLFSLNGPEIACSQDKADIAEDLEFDQDFKVLLSKAEATQRPAGSVNADTKSGKCSGGSSKGFQFDLFGGDE